MVLTPQGRRDAAFTAIATERDYQDAGLGNSAMSPERTLEMRVIHETGGRALTLGEGILVMEKILDDAKRHWYKPEEYEAALVHVRKIAGVATQLMENYGAPPRVFGEMRVADKSDSLMHHRV